MSLGRDQHHHRLNSGCPGGFLSFCLSSLLGSETKNRSARGATSTKIGRGSEEREQNKRTGPLSHSNNAVAHTRALSPHTSFLGARAVISFEAPGVRNRGLSYLPLIRSSAMYPLAKLPLPQSATIAVAHATTAHVFLVLKHHQLAQGWYLRKRLLCSFPTLTFFLFLRKRLT